MHSTTNAKYGTDLCNPADLHFGAVVEYVGTQEHAHGRYVVESPCICPRCFSMARAAGGTFPFPRAVNYRLAGAEELGSPTDLLNHVRPGHLRLVAEGPVRPVA